MTAYSAKDLERAREFLQYECCWSADGSAAFAEDVAKYAALVRRETVEECARVADVYAKRMGAASAARPDAIVPRCKQDAGESIAAGIRALLDAPKAETHRPQVVMITPEEAAGVLVARLDKAEPRCRVCGDSVEEHVFSSRCMHFEPEEPGHE